MGGRTVGGWLQALARQVPEMHGWRAQAGGLRMAREMGQPLVCPGASWLQPPPPISRLKPSSPDPGALEDHLELTSFCILPFNVTLAPGCTACRMSANSSPSPPPPPPLPRANQF